MQDEFQFAIDVAQEAGNITLQYFQKPVEIITKDDDSPVTIADRSAEEYIREEIEKRFPDDGILGEEFGEKTSRNNRRWIIDPIDGTKSFVRGVPLYGTMVALEDNGKSQIGVIRYPATGETLAALVGSGCFYNGEPCHVSQTDALHKATLMITAMKDTIKHLGKDVFLKLIESTALQRTWGDCYGYLLVATGRADIAMDPELKIWDLASLIPIIQEAGGKITDRDGNTSLTMPHSIASNGLFHDELVKLFNE